MIAAGEKKKVDPVEEADIESFPASDPPAWTTGASDADEEDKGIVVQDDPDTCSGDFPASDPPAWTTSASDADEEDEDIVVQDDPDTRSGADDLD